MNEPYTPGIQDLIDAYTYVMGPSEAKERRETAERILAAHDADLRKKIAEEIPNNVNPPANVDDHEWRQGFVIGVLRAASFAEGSGK